MCVCARTRQTCAYVQHTDGLIVDGEGAEHALRVDDVGAAHGHTVVLVVLVLHQHVELARNVLGQVGQQREIQLAHAAVLAGRARPGEVSVVRVYTDADDLGAQLLELSVLFVELDNLRRADKSEVERVEEEHDPLALELLGREIDDVVAEHGLAGPRGRGLADCQLGRRWSHRQRHECCHSEQCAPPAKTGTRRVTSLRASGAACSRTPHAGPQTHLALAERPAGTRARARS